MACIGRLGHGAFFGAFPELTQAVMTDIDQKVAEGSIHSLIRAAGPLRQLLLNATPLVHEVNRAYRKKIEFEVIDFHNQPPVLPQAPWQDFDGSHFSGAASISVNLDKLLRAPCLKLDNTTAEEGKIFNDLKN